MSIMDITEKRAFEKWEAGAPAHANHPDEERKAGDTLLVPLYDGDGIVNVLSVSGDGSATFSAMVHPKNRREPTRGIAKTTGVVAVAGRAKIGSNIIPGAEISGSEREYAGGRLAGASHVFLTVGWSDACRIFETTGEPAVAALEGGLLSGNNASVGENLIRVARDLRHALPDQAAITIAVRDDRTPATQERQRQADITACQAEEYAREFDTQNAKAWKTKETQEAAERARMEALSVTLFGAAAHVAVAIRARLLKLGRVAS